MPDRPSVALDNTSMTQDRANPPTPAAPSSSPADATQQTGGSSSGSLLIVVIPSLAVGITILLLLAKSAREKRLLIDLEAEIRIQGRALGTRRQQLRVKDDYGTTDENPWLKEVARFVHTRLVPIAERGEMVQTLSKPNFLQKVYTLINEVAVHHEYQTPELVSDFASSPSRFDDRMNPVHYEMYCANLLRLAGWRTRQTPVTGDQGADIIADKNGIIMIFQCKLYSRPVGNDAVQQAFAAKHFHNANLAAVVTNNEFTRPARRLAATNGVLLMHHSELASFTTESLQAQSA